MTAHRPSFIASRINGIETLRFGNRPRNLPPLICEIVPHASFAADGFVSARIKTPSTDWVELGDFLRRDHAFEQVAWMAEAL